MGEERKRWKHTRTAVQVSEVEDVSCAADGVARGAEANLALFEGSSEGSGGSEGEDGGDGELHFDGGEKLIYL